jgi:hypothetical protein
MIAYYVHHQGSGHLHRAAAIAEHMITPVVGLSSLRRPPGWTGGWMRLPGDSSDVDPTTADVSAGGTLHWVPRGHQGLRARMGLIAGAVADSRTRLLVADVSVEVALLARLHGLPVVVVAQLGERTDRPHRLAYDLAERLLAPWPARAQPAWPQSWRVKAVHVGAFSRFDGLPRTGASLRRRVLALWGSGGLDIGIAALRSAAAATPEWTWEVVGPRAPLASGPRNLCWRGWLADIWPALCAADVVVTHAGQNALAEVAAARRPAVVVPQDRPHGEQRACAEALDRLGIAVVRATWPEDHEWPGLLDQAAHCGGDAWSAWSFGDGAARAAGVLDELALTGA